jgi:ribosomal protein S27AE
VCDGVIEPVDANIGIQVMTPCPSCATLVIVEAEEIAMCGKCGSAKDTHTSFPDAHRGEMQLYCINGMGKFSNIPNDGLIVKWFEENDPEALKTAISSWQRENGHEENYETD